MKEVNLPLMDEPEHPRLQQYAHAHRKAWSTTIAAANAFVLVTPEYNFSTAPALLNAFERVRFSLQGVELQARRIRQLRRDLGRPARRRDDEADACALKVVPLVGSVALSFAMKLVSDQTLAATDGREKSASAMLDELHR